MCSRRNAFLMLCNEQEDLAIEFLAHHLEDVPAFGDGFALLVLELTRRVCRRDPTQKSRFVRVLFQMLSSNSPAVSYEAAWTLVSLSTAPTAVRAAALTYTSLLNGHQNDNNVANTAGKAKIHTPEGAVCVLLRYLYSTIPAASFKKKEQPKNPAGIRFPATYEFPMRRLIDHFSMCTRACTKVSSVCKHR